MDAPAPFTWRRSRVSMVLMVSVLSCNFLIFLFIVHVSFWPLMTDMA